MQQSIEKIDLRIIDKISLHPRARRLLRSMSGPQDFPTRFGDWATACDGIIMDSPELRQWRSQVGLLYTLENHLPIAHRPDLLDNALIGLDFDSVLEVGCNLGHNLGGFVKQGKRVFGVDLLEEVLSSQPWGGAVGTAFALPFPDNSLDLVLCAGVLCHIALERAASAILEIERVCRKYVIVIDYSASEELACSFRGAQLMWRRDFQALIEGVAGSLKPIRSGITQAWDGRSSMKCVVFGK